MQLVETNPATQDNCLSRLGTTRILGDWCKPSATPRFSGATTSTDDWLVVPTRIAVTGLGEVVGSWRDERDVEEIVRDIYDSRTI